jgi:ketosteroid isomerase-like protein
VPGAAIDLVVAAAEAATRRDPDALVAVCASDIEFEPSMAGLEVDVYRGHAGIRKWMDDLHAIWDDFSGVVDDFEEIGADSVLVRLTVHGRARGSGVELEQRFWHLWTVRDGKLWRERASPTSRRRCRRPRGSDRERDHGDRVRDHIQLPPLAR